MFALTMGGLRCGASGHVAIVNSAVARRIAMLAPSESERAN